MMPNIENINRVIEVIGALPPKRFNMDCWAFDLQRQVSIAPAEMVEACDTCGCIGGWTLATFGRRDGHTVEAGKLLGLDEAQAGSLFYPPQRDDGRLWYDKITRAQAIRVLEHLRDTGEVDWSKRGRR